MVVERRRGRSWASSDGRNNSSRGLTERSRFTALEVNEREIYVVFNDKINGSIEVVTKERSNIEGHMWLGFPEKDVIGTKRKQAKLKAKGKKTCDGEWAKVDLEGFKAQ
ncbi:hypothetical protein Goari_018006 [Gossypium aridum]|uniref:Uncharacterized protein n=1 Tax=Gossypium aridum TaxID=34290 RepID=A0A7J8WN98_GOSAI|nr:hypothetical protein [Gossypium aridum]